ncbi:MAG: trigger factor [Bacillota bacterium]
MVKVNVEKLDGSKVSLTVEAPASVVDTALDKAYKTVVKRINVPGFRRGKAPRYILERHFGKEVLYEDAMKEALPEQYVEAVKEAKIEPVDDPDFDDVHFKQGEPLTFKATVFVIPEVKLDDYSDLSVAYEPPLVSDEDVNGQVNYLRERMAELRPLDEGQVLEAGDSASCHAKGIEGGSFKAEIDQDFSYVEVGRENALVPGMGEALKGMKKGEVKEFTGTYPSDEVKEGETKQPEQPRDSKFQVEVKECHRKHFPSEEDFLKNLSKATMDEVREDLRVRMLAARTDTARRQQSDKVEDALLAKATVEIPQVMIERKQEELFERFAQRLQDAGANVDSYLRSTGRAPEDIAKDFLTEAEKEVKRELVLDAVISKENVKVSDEAVNKVVEALARQTGKDVEAVKTTLELRGALADIEHNLLRVEALKKIAVLAAEKAGVPLPEDKSAEPSEEKPAEPSEEKPAEPEAK